ncbi:hypothetical protein Ade02nite_93690 [Paractinoplanes deccanensis]|uniref:Uncharacterized protein n=1 Tax=Paractinoplanes deccanensis TaxID=113561 RepID=A0ABQ3YL46_9ACTN|nr:hypothetical protein [Actinoplanes deccanensis]GID80728.1 hypothetical protein Ade02nite_93690 [Actinoplanes deccanensis]
MTVSLGFAGWFQCRLATDPDPADEPRGVSGYVHALPGEPDLDRVVRFQPEGTVPRRFCPPIGVTVHSVRLDGRPQADHPLLGAAVDLLGTPVFEGRNGIVADDGFEPIVPFHLQISADEFRLRRAHRDREEFPFDDLKPTGVQPGLTDVVDATGIADLADVWRHRKDQVDEALTHTTDETARTALAERSALLANTRLAAIFPFRMLYSIALTGSGECHDPRALLPGPVTLNRPWLADFWLGGWDADALSGFVKGTLQVVPASTARVAEAEPFAPPPTAPRAPRRP